MKMTQEQLDQFFLDKGYEIKYRYYHNKQYSCYWKRDSNGELTTRLLGYSGNIYDKIKTIKDKIFWETVKSSETFEDDPDEELYRMEMDGEYF